MLVVIGYDLHNSSSENYEKLDNHIKNQLGGVRMFQSQWYIYTKPGATHTPASLRRSIKPYIKPDSKVFIGCIVPDEGWTTIGFRIQ